MRVTILGTRGNIAKSAPVFDSSAAKAQQLVDQERVRLLPVVKAMDFRLDSHRD